MRSIDSAAKWIGTAAGIALAVVLVLSWRVGAEGRMPLSAAVGLHAAPSGELELRPAAEFLSARRLTAGGRGASGTLLVENITPVPLDVRVRLEPSSRALDRALRVRLEAGGRRLADARLGALRHWSAGSMRIDPGRSALLRAHLLLPTGPSAVAAGGQDVDVAVRFRARAVGASP